MADQPIHMDMGSKIPMRVAIRHHRALHVRGEGRDALLLTGLGGAYGTVLRSMTASLLRQ